MATLVAMKSLEDAFMCYNSGPVAGSSQEHKHMHIIPVRSLINQKIPIHDRVMDALQRAQVLSESNPVRGHDTIESGAYGNE